LVLDDADLIFSEYRRYLSLSGQPGVGDVFIKWVHDRQWDSTVCTRVSITSHGERTFEEFPDDPGLAKFDRDDRKFVAVAAVHPDVPTILQAVDRKWLKWNQALAAVGITVRFLCSPPSNSSNAV